MKYWIVVLSVIFLYSCNSDNNSQKTTGDTTIKKTDTMQKAAVDTGAIVYCYITKIEKRHDSNFIQADYVEYFTGPNVVEEAKKRHRADTSVGKDGKLDIFVPDDYFIVNDDKTTKTLLLPANAPIHMDAQIAGPGKRNIDNLDYFAVHYENNLFRLKVKDNVIQSLYEVFLP
ncbi:MAG TPA: hypothetical protein VKH37_13300 [Ferruginibacter sp.]|nr:hypothetical protein [Ferruginibacter sp.]